MQGNKQHTIAQPRYRTPTQRELVTDIGAGSIHYQRGARIPSLIFGRAGNSVPKLRNLSDHEGIRGSLWRRGLRARPWWMQMLNTKTFCCISQRSTFQKSAGSSMSVIFQALLRVCG
jgi:hypothetical protein